MTDKQQVEQAKADQDKALKLDDTKNETDSPQLEAPVQEQLTGDETKEPVPVNESSQKDKHGIYKALAIKLKKELLKTREELYKVRDEYRTEKDQLQKQVDTLSSSLESERVTRANTNATLEATVRNLRGQLEKAENELQSMQKDFDNYKARATKLLQQANPVQLNFDRSFEEERLKQLKRLSEEQHGQLGLLKKQVDELTSERDKLEADSASLQRKLDEANRQIKDMQAINQNLSSENDDLHTTIEQINTRSRVKQWNENSNKKIESTTPMTTENAQDVGPIKTEGRQERDDYETVDDSNTNSNSSVDSSTCSYVHIKPTTFEIVSRSSVLENAQNQIDSLTKAYLDSESTNSLLKEQVEVLKEEIRRIQRGNERMELANNLEYLKNIMFKFLSLDSSQFEQRQRLVPVLSTVLKLSPEETSKLNSIAAPDKTSVASSFFKL